MGGGLLNLVAVGSQNIILNGNPTASFFKAVYKKYTNFGLQKFRIDYNGLRKLNYSEPTKLTFKVPRYAELLMDTYIVLNLPNIWSPIIPPGDCKGTWLPYEFKWIPNLGFHMISDIEISVGGQILQKFSGETLLNQMKRDFNKSKRKLTEEMIGNVPELYDPANSNNNNGFYPNAYYTQLQSGAEPSIRGRKLYIPLNSWFSVNSRLSFPLVCLQYNELHITVTFRPIYQMFQIRDINNITSMGGDAEDNNGFENKFSTEDPSTAPMKKSKYWGHPISEIPYVAPQLNDPWHHFYRFLQTPPSVSITQDDYKKFGKITNEWNADVHLISTYCFLSTDESKLFASSAQQYLIKEAYETIKYNIFGSNKLELMTMGLISDFMVFMKRSDVGLRNEWDNYTNWAYNTKPRKIFSLAPSYGNAMNGPWKTISSPLAENQKYGTNVNATNIYRDTENNIYNKFLYYQDYYNAGVISDQVLINRLACNEGSPFPPPDTYSNGILSNNTLFSTLGLLPKQPNNPSQDWRLLPGINPVYDCSENIVNEGGNENNVGWSIGGMMPYAYPPIKITGNYNSENQKEILLMMGILLDGKYRENLLDSGIYGYVEKYNRVNGASDTEFMYCYNYGLNSSYNCQSSNLISPQPSGAINLSKFNKVELEINTYTPPLNNQAQTAVICDEEGDIVGINKSTWDIYKYTYNIHIIEYKYNIVKFESGNVGLEWAR